MLALTGTPGTGKTTVAALLADHATVVDVRTLSERCDALEGEDLERGALVIDEHVLHTHAREHLPATDGPVVVEGLMAHHADPDIVIALRCHPDRLRSRLQARGWRSAKVEENVMAEALDAIVLDIDGPEAYEVDTTDVTPEEVAALIAPLLKGDVVRDPRLCPLGAADWSGTLLGDVGR